MSTENKAESSVIYAKHTTGIKRHLPIISFVLIPALIATFYYLFIAADIYISDAQITVQTEQSDLPSDTSAVSSFLSVGQNLQDPFIVKSYITSPTLLEILARNYDLAAKYQHPDADFYKRLKDEHSKESLYSYYKNMVKVKLNDQGGILEIKVRAFSSEDSNAIMLAVLKETEEFVNKTSERMQEDSMSFVNQTAQQAQTKLLKSIENLSTFRNQNESFDPEKVSTGILGVVQQLESQVAMTQAELDSALSFYQPGSPQVETLQAKLSGLRAQVKKQNERLADDEGAQLADLLDQYQSLVLKRDFAQERYEAAISALEAAQLDSQKKRKYLIRVVEPTLPESAVEPKRIYNSITVFIILLVSYGIIKLISAAIKDAMI